MTDLLTLPPARGGWTETELRALQAACAPFDLCVEVGVSDEGDPWCLLHDEVIAIAHIARVDRRYLVHRPGVEPCRKFVRLSDALALIGPARRPSSAVN